MNWGKRPNTIRSIEMLSAEAHPCHPNTHTGIGTAFRLEAEITLFWATLHF